MRWIFADTCYWIATINPRDNLHSRTMVVMQSLQPFRLITSDMVLVEVLNAFGDWGEYIRRAAVAAIQEITADTSTEIVPQTRRLFQEALDLYRQRPDKDWSLTDCASFIIMNKREITEALTNDIHFIQSGYSALIGVNQNA
jgi:uncharacterized protein